MQVKSVVSLVVTLGLLAGLVGQKLSYPTPADTDEYHRKIRELVEAFPLEIGPWDGKKIDVPPSALAMLKPNAIVSREYRNEDTRQRVSVLVEHCRDARDMAGHYPPVCYKSHGWTPHGESRETWTTTDEATGAESVVEGMAYEFAQSLPGRASFLVVHNVFVLPDGSTARDMQGVRALASDYIRHFYGAGQIQVVFSTHVSASEREKKERKAITELFLSAARPVMDAISSGVTDEQ